MSIAKLHVLDIRGCPLSWFPSSLFQGLTELRALHTDNYKMCCPVLLPQGFNEDDCEAPAQVISACDFLLGPQVLRVLFPIFTILSTLGNLVLLTVLIRKGQGQSAAGILLVTLCFSHVVMGVYTAIISMAHLLYHGTYLFQDKVWRHGITCTASAFLSSLSSQVSTLTLFLITVDSCLGLGCCPWGPRQRFGRRSSRVACMAAWIVGIVITALLVFPVSPNPALHSQTAVCLPVPLSSDGIEDYGFVFMTVTVLNVCVSVMTAAGQLVVFVPMYVSEEVTEKAILEHDDSDLLPLAVTDDRFSNARFSATIAAMDFFRCVFIGGLFLLFSSGATLIRDMYSVLVVVALPMSSCLTPVLYILNILIEQRRLTRQRRLLKIILARSRIQKHHRRR